jgi:hypothetical protein
MPRDNRCSKIVPLVEHLAVHLGLEPHGLVRAFRKLLATGKGAFYIPARKGEVLRPHGSTPFLNFKVASKDLGKLQIPAAGTLEFLL